MKYRKITSKANPHITEIVRLREGRTGVRHNAYLIEGPHLLEMALQSGVPIMKIFAAGAFIDSEDGGNLLARTHAEVYEVTEQVLGKMADTETPQGVVAVVRHEPVQLDGLPLNENPLLVIVDAIQDPGNLGTIIRTADAAGADAVILLPGSCDAFKSKTIRATAGSIFTIPVVSASVDTLMNLLSRRAIRLVATTVDARDTLFESDLRDGIAFAFGNEARGIGDRLRKAADLLVSIPIIGRAESLNVATSAAICLYEAVRQRSG